jgi:acetyl-CoA carboxylase biotin carboxyl carrier protein
MSARDPGHNGSERAEHDDGNTVTGLVTENLFPRRIQEAPASSGTDPVPFGDLRAEAERLIDRTDRTVRRVNLTSGVSGIEVDWEPARPTPPPAAPESVPAGPSTAPAAVPRSEPVQPPGPVESATGYEIRSPLVGTFYHSPAPGQDPFVQIGSRVEAGEQVAIVEAMKLLTPVTTDRTGIVVSIDVADADVVEFGQVLFTIDPAASGGEGQ